MREPGWNPGRFSRSSHRVRVASRHRAYGPGPRASGSRAVRIVRAREADVYVQNSALEAVDPPIVAGYRVREHIMGESGEQSLKPIRVVVASPGDVQAERERLAAVIEELNAELEGKGQILRLYRWETDAAPGFHLLGPQGQVDHGLKIENCDILIGIFWKRFGTPVADAGSGTEHEFRIAYEHWKNSGGLRPRIMLYFCTQPFFPSSEEENEQVGRVLAFRKTHEREALFCEFAREIDFERAVRRHLRQAAQDISDGPTRETKVAGGFLGPVPVNGFGYDYTVPVGRDMFFGR